MTRTTFSSNTISQDTMNSPKTKMKCISNKITSKMMMMPLKTAQQRRVCGKETGKTGFHQLQIVIFQSRKTKLKLTSTIRKNNLLWFLHKSVTNHLKIYQGWG